MAFGTMNGPTFLGPFSLVISAACTIAHETAQAAVDQLVDIHFERAGDLAAEAEIAVLGNELDAGFAVPERARHLGGIVADRRDDAQARDDDALHVSRPPRRRPHPGPARPSSH